MAGLNNVLPSVLDMVGSGGLDDDGDTNVGAIIGGIVGGIIFFLIIVLILCFCYWYCCR